MTYNYLSQADFIMFAFNLCKWLLIVAIPLALLEYAYDKKPKKVIIYKGIGLHKLIEFTDNQLAVHGEIDFSKDNAR